MAAIARGLPLQPVLLHVDLDKEDTAERVIILPRSTEEVHVLGRPKKPEHVILNPVQVSMNFFIFFYIDF
jgi:hypothetical protein